MTITQAQFNENPYEATVCFLALPSTGPYAYRDDFSMSWTLAIGYYYDYWGVAGVPQPSISTIINSDITADDVARCVTDIWG